MTAARSMLTHWRGWVVSVLVAVVFAGVSVTAVARDLDWKALKKGMSLPDVIQTFGQPDRMEWINASGQPVLFLFYETEDKRTLLQPFGKDVLKETDGRSFLPLGFVTERLAGWGKKFYIRLKSPQ